MNICSRTIAIGPLFSTLFSNLLIPKQGLELQLFPKQIEQILWPMFAILMTNMETRLKAWFLLVLTIVRIGNFYDFPTSGILTTSGNTRSQTVVDFYVIGRIGTICTFKVYPRWSPTSAIFTMSVNIKFACLGHQGCLILSFLATKS